MQSTKSEQRKNEDHKPEAEHLQTFVIKALEMATGRPIIGFEMAEAD